VNNHKALLVYRDTGTFGLCANLTDYQTASAKSFSSGAFLFDVDAAAATISERGRIQKDDSNFYYGGERLVVVGGNLYYFEYGLLRSFDFETLAAKGRLFLPA
jgi:hypothetical protein